MAKNTFQLNYDEMTAIAKKFKDEGEDITRLHANTRQRVRDLYKEWVGEGAEKFFEEMETKLLPAVQRLAHALFLSQDATNDIMKIIQGADEETVGFFRNQLVGDDFGASTFNAALQGLQGGVPGADDFGAGKFGDALNNPPTDNESSPTDGHNQTGDSTSSQDRGESSDKNQKQLEETKTEPTSGGGGGGSSSSQGFKGDLKNMGVGLSDQVPQDATSGGGSGSPVNMPDHVYSGGDSPKPDGPPSGVETGSGNNGQSSSESGGSGVGGVAGAAGAAAAGGGAKVIKKRKKKNS